MLCSGFRSGRSAGLTLRGSNDERDDRAEQHDTRDDVEGARVAACSVVHVGDQRRAEHASEPPGGYHQPVDGPHVLGSEVVGVKGRHSPETAAVAGDNNESEDGQQEEREAENRYEEEQRRLQEVHYQKDPLAADGVRELGPKEPSRAVGNGDDAY